MVDIRTIVITCTIITFCESYAVVEKAKCTLSDSDCQSKLLRGILQDIADKGDNDLGISPLDPYVIKNFDVPLLGMVKLHVKEGKATGFKNCHSNSFKVDVEKLRAHVEYTCDTFHIEGKNKISTLPAFDTLLGGLKVHGDGEGKIDFEKANMVLDFAFGIVKLDDGEYHIELKPEESSHSLDIAGKVAFDFNNVFVGSQDISSVLTPILNENWQTFHKIFGQTIQDKIMGVFYENCQKFFKGVPAKDLISDDLSKYVKS